jgi:DnaJ like chaperone protein
MRCVSTAGDFYLPLKHTILFKIVFAVVGFLITKSFIGAIIGFSIGSLVDNYQKMKANGGTQGSGGTNSFSSEDIFGFYQQRSSTNDFPTMLIALSAAVMRADGKVVKAELSYVKSFFAQQFGPDFSVQHLQTLKQFLDSNDIPLERICQDIRMRTQEEVRIQLLHYLFGIAKADGNVADIEITVLERIATLMGIQHADFRTVKNMFYRDVNSDYAVLGVEPTATDEEVKKAYRQMAIRYHPDKVASLGEEYQHGAKEKFQKIQEAYDTIKKSRGM